MSSDSHIKNFALSEALHPKPILEKGGIQFIGPCLFDLKLDTVDALEEQQDRGYCVVMITGDNTGTGVFVAKR
ncbi:UNVERIFIED_CONTAM: hypothetical protein HDU68_000742 [Siphonaria sp. JEL0065]|nr:hypothetical protein HDU68_000742 [Siphonaria sp. JEL0065]